ncbi:MAG: nitrate reductase, partial [Deltaproteobacteria bacterium]|nr:nitrate reductase [Deltaproteobacteria bacterium]
LFGRAPVHTFSRTTNTPMLLEIFPENELWVNAEMARILGLRRGDRVMLENGDGVKTGPIRVRATERIRQDCVYMVHGFGRENRKLRASFGKGANDSRLITRVKRDPIMGGTGMNVNFVTLTKEA